MTVAVLLQFCSDQGLPLRSISLKWSILKPFCSPAALELHKKILREQ